MLGLSSSTHLLWLVVSLADGWLVAWLPSILWLARGSILGLLSRPWASSRGTGALGSDLGLYGLSFFCFTN